MKWLVRCSGFRDYDAHHAGFIQIEADQMFVSPAGVQFLNTIPEPPIELCGVGEKPCVRPKGHTGKHLDKLKPKRPKMICIRAILNFGPMDVSLVP